MRKRNLAIGIAMTLAMAACGSGGIEGAREATVPAPPDTTQPAPPTTAALNLPDVKLGETEIGPVLTGPEGLTLYGFTNDTDATSACYGTCADAWPPVIVDVDFTAGPGVDVGILATALREDGSLQLVAGKWPLYYFAGDAAPGDVNGQGSGAV